MLASYTFNSHYTPNANQHQSLPSLRLLEGGKFTPGQFSPVLVKEYNQIRLKYFQWGMVPAWTKGSKKEKARRFVASEQLLRQPGFQLTLRRQRCLIPADGYYLSQGKTYNKQNWKIHADGGDTFCFAGVYDTWRNADGSLLQSFAILTTEADADMRQFGLQMPLILPKKHEALWLNPHANMQKIYDVLKQPYPVSLQIYPIQELKEMDLIGFYDHVAA
ncbi:MAG: SOS response-associated peptidase family protein [Bacteroidota bacterium]